MKIALIGYGKMGKTIEQIAIEKGHEIVLRIGSTNTADFTKEALQKADVAIEFSTPEIAWTNIQKCLAAGIPTVCGTTAWLQHLEEANQMAIANNTAFHLMNEHPSYNVGMTEIHHTAKKDAPSGTAVTLAEGILKNITRKEIWTNAPETKANELSIISERIDPAPGTHSIKYTSDIDDIEITHTAHNRIGFASGAIVAAEFLQGKKGIFTMKDVLQLG
jgi:4-hydroxy-tetrahydrodipicolinate reductase